MGRRIGCKQDGRIRLGERVQGRIGVEHRGTVGEKEGLGKNDVGGRKTGGWVGRRKEIGVQGKSKEMG